MNRFDLRDDDVLLALLSESLNEVDPVPDTAVAAAMALAQLGDADAELATLVADSLMDDDVVLFRHDVALAPLGETIDRALSFATPTFSADIELQADGSTLVGSLAPPLSMAVDVETTRTKVTTYSDELGRFHAEIGAGRCRLRFHTADGVVVTPWITR